ncbi:MAG: cysteine--tRNA ligase [Acidimicrobiia bacterium]
MQVYNTLARALAPFEPSSPDRVTMYLCGPTVQSEPHLGHGRSAVAFDVLRRYLEWNGYDVEFVRNVTDVDDKIIKRAIESGMTTDEVAAQAFGAFTDAYDRLGNLRPTIEPKATEHVSQMISLVADLIAKGNAYESGGDVYFSVRSFEAYGALSRHDLNDLRAGDRVEPGELKRDPLDFALWKSSKPGEPSWPSPWGEGRPGWHIECSAMAAEYLGNDFDVHAGGTDLIFPHHENEIAQSEAATGERFAKYWMHNGMLNLSGEKMAKSTGHVVTLRSALDEWDPMAVRLFYLRTHYRKPLEFSDAALDDAEASLARLRSFRRRAPDQVEAPPDPDAIAGFRTAMDNDLDASGALAVLFDVVRRGNAGLDASIDIAPLVAAYDEIIGILGLTADAMSDDVDISDVATELGLKASTVDDLLLLREAARTDRDWGTADAIRDRLLAEGIVIEDTSDGARWHRN